MKEPRLSCPGERFTVAELLMKASNSTILMSLSVLPLNTTAAFFPLTHFPLFGTCCWETGRKRENNLQQQYLGTGSSYRGTKEMAFSHWDPIIKCVHVPACCASGLMISFLYLETRLHNDIIWKNCFLLFLVNKGWTGVNKRLITDLLTPIGH